MFKIALGQMLVEGGRKEANLARAQAMIARAAQRGARLVVLPETLNAGWTYPETKRLADPIPDGESCRALCEAARERGVYVCAGLAERAGKKTYNAAVLIRPDGGVALHSRKINVLEIGQGCYAIGDRLGVVETPLGVIGLMICADGFARGQCVSRTLGYMGAQIILSPSAWAVPPDHDNTKQPYGKLWLDNYRPVARDFLCWIAGVSNVGRVRGGAWNGWKCIGCSLVVGPTGQKVLQGPYGADAEALLEAEVEPLPRPAQGTGWDRYWRRNGL